MTHTTELVKWLRQSLSQSEITRRTGVPQSRISRWEAGEVPQSADDIFKLQALKAQIEEEKGEGNV